MPNFTDLSQPLATFEARLLDASRSSQIALSDVWVDGQSLPDQSFAFPQAAPNADPVASDAAASATEGGAPVEGTLSATDADGDALTFALDAPFAGLSLQADGAWSFDPADPAYDGLAAGETQEIAAGFTVSDGNGGTDAGTLTISVAGANDAPVEAAPLTGQTATQGAAFSFSVPSEAFLDADGDALTLSAALAGGGALPAWLSFAPATRAFSGTPGNGDVGALDVVLTAQDPSGATATSAFTLTVADLNDAPVASDASASATEGGASVAGTLSATDPDGDPLAFTLDAPVPGLSLQTDGAWSFDPTGPAYDGLAAGETQEIAAGFTVSDGKGGTDAGTLTISVAGADEVLVGGRGRDVLKGGSSDDRLIGRGGNDKLVGQGGDDVMKGNGGKDKLIGKAGNDVARGGGGNDVLKGGGGKDKLFGQKGADKLLGGGGNDKLVGNGGGDTLQGQRGNDKLKGGGGKDEFVFKRGDGKDVILDWRDGKDTIVIKKGASGFEDLDIYQKRKHAFVDYGKNGDLIKLKKTDADDLDADDFLFG